MMKICGAKTALITLTRLLLLFIIQCAAQSASAQNSHQDSYLVRPDGIGRFDDPQISLADVQQRYPDLKMSIESGAPGAMWRKGSRNDDGLTYFVFRLAGEELFRASCGCFRDDAGAWTDQRGGRNISLFDLKFSPVVMSRKFYTATGVRVGSTVSELRKAYSQTKNLTAVLWIDESGPYTTEFVCFNAGISNPNDTTINNMNFYVRPANGKKLAGRYENSPHTTNIDPSAVIVAIAPQGGCLLNSQPK